jgi:hypothetical protein
VWRHRLFRACRFVSVAYVECLTLVSVFAASVSTYALSVWRHRRAFHLSLRIPAVLVVEAAINGFVALIASLRQVGRGRCLHAARSHLRRGRARIER